MRRQLDRDQALTSPALPAEVSREARPRRPMLCTRRSPRPLFTRPHSTRTSEVASRRTSCSPAGGLCPTACDRRRRGGGGSLPVPGVAAAGARAAAAAWQENPGGRDPARGAGSDAAKKRLLRTLLRSGRCAMGTVADARGLARSNLAAPAHAPRSRRDGIAGPERRREDGGRGTHYRCPRNADPKKGSTVIFPANRPARSAENATTTS
jgi:hypothetical protein